MTEGAGWRAVKVKVRRVRRESGTGGREEVEKVGAELEEGQEEGRSQPRAELLRASAPLVAGCGSLP